MSCPCETAAPLELTRDAITRRAKLSRQLKRSLELLAEHSDREHQLWRCGSCGGLWQRALAWNWGDKEYFFTVPTIEAGDWREQPFVDPDELLIWASTMDRFIGQGNFQPTSRSCSEPGCMEAAIAFSSLCLPHHIANLQAVRAFPQTPRGRFFPPYERLTPEGLATHLAEAQHGKI